MDLARIARHLFVLPAAARRAFPPGSLDAIEKAIREAERTHAGQIRFAVESALDVAMLLRGGSARERALEVFSQLRVWDTEHNNGVLIYLLLAERDVEIVADRGIHARTGPQWEEVCRAMEAELRQGNYEKAVTDGIRAVARHLARHFPGSRANELPDRPVVL
ncbi:MAG: hypothetical protein E6H44_09530 [Betaproteobacteria bacterium]|nr:MAG: hypothetical protein E6H44_09530 [Betaproteobacteria bacterium]TMI00855.1 MAG: hypothetical protein E6H43_10445 [Betaproteobacteria bacterium]